MENKKLTIGMIVYDDYSGLYFTIQAIRMYHREVLDQIAFVVINTNPSSAHGKAVKDFCAANWVKEPLQYFEDDNSMGTATRSKIFDYAQTPYVLVMDPHVMLEPGALSKLITFFDDDKDRGGLVQGPLLYDHLVDGPAKFKREWRAGMYGTWEMDDRIHTEEYFEIDGQGLGVFACRKDSWVGFGKHHRGFGGEEILVADRFKKDGKPTVCLSSLRWLHRFGRPEGAPYVNRYEDRVKNYINSFLDLDMPVSEIFEHFNTVGISEETLQSWLAEVITHRSLA